VILRINPGSAAETAGLRSATIYRDGSITPGDIVVAINGKQVDSVARLLARLDDFKVGDPVSLTLLREGNKLEVELVLQPGL
jgi:S1-C subfamily serine protease